MMKTVQTFILVPLVAMLAGAQSSCPVSLIVPKPSGLHCGGTFAPNAKTGAANLIQAVSGVDQQTCAAACFGNTACRSFTHSASSQVCKSYKQNGAKMGLVASGDDTMFYNKNCYERLPCFRMVVSAPGTNFDAQTIYTDVDTLANPARFSSSASNASATSTDPTIFSIRKDGTIFSGLVGVNSAQVHDDAADDVDQYAYDLYFPTNSNITANFPLYPVACAIDATSSALTCSSHVGDTFYGCDDGAVDYGSGLAIGPAGSTSSLLSQCTVIAMKAVVPS